MHQSLSPKEINDFVKAAVKQFLAGSRALPR
jgi:hypothetical protein